ncbi:MAG: adenylate/guanylate cyclase domain-containing protein [Desulfobacteraceae bacterium]|nr:adenylate/guanylate cyclase domain-containing protein [Desulfobacteraceae bacterium]
MAKNKIHADFLLIWRPGSVCFGIFLAVFLCNVLGFFNGFENRTFDLRTQIWRHNKQLSEKIVLVLVDEVSLAAMEPLTGRWPWRRDVHAGLIEFLSVCGARAVVFDVLFPERSSSFSYGFAEPDLKLQSATKEAGNVIHACQLVQDEIYSVTDSKVKIGATCTANSISSYHGDLSWFQNDYDTIYWPYGQLAKVSAGVGVTTFAPDKDGAYRRAELLFKFQNAVFPGLSILPLDSRNEGIGFTGGKKGLTIFLDAAKYNVPLDNNLKYIVNPYGKYNAFSYSGVYLSAMRLQQGQVENLPVGPSEFKDKIVFIGASAAGVEDLKMTCLGQLEPGVVLHASILGNLLDNDYIRYLNPYLNWSFTFLAIAAITATLWFLKSLYKQIMLSFGVLCGVIIFNVALFRFNTLSSLAPALFGIFASYLVSFSWISFGDRKEKRKIKTVLGQYVSPVVLSTVLKGHKDAFISAEVGQRQNLTLLFSDIRGFTAITENCPVEDVVLSLNRYLETMVDVIFYHNGTLDKFIGDAVMAFWGAPVQDPEHALKAVLSAIAMQKALIAYNKQQKDTDLPVFETGIGIHTDEMILGNIGSQKKLDYTVIGDGVNLTSRLEGLTKFYGVPVLLSESTYQFMRKRVCCRLVDFVKVKGKDRCTRIYTPLGRSEEVGAAEIQLAQVTHDAFDCYQSSHFGQAIGYYEKILKNYPFDTLSRIFIDRCKHYQVNHPEGDWGGAYSFYHK